MENLTFGIWILHDYGIRCSFWMHRNSVIFNNTLNNTEMTKLGSVWEYPVHFARKDWTTPEILQDLMTALASQRLLLGMDQRPDIDRRTWSIALNIINKRSLAA